MTYFEKQQDPKVESTNETPGSCFRSVNISLMTSHQTDASVEVQCVASMNPDTFP